MPEFMTNTRSIEMASWQAFVSHVDELSANLSEPPWFRGQAEEWPLRPRLLRHFRRRRLSDVNQALAIERQATDEFKKAAHLYLAPARLQQLADAAHGDLPIGAAAWWTIMRHHGAPTRLLDWTLSPYVAAYFASESSLDKEPPASGVVAVLDFGSLRAHMDGAYASKDGPTRITDKLVLAPDAPDDLLPLFHKMPTERMLAQQGCFTICRNVLGDHGQLIEGSVPGALTYLLIPDDVKAEFRRRLRQVNLTGHTMFGDLDGLGRHTDEAVALLVDQADA